MHTISAATAPGRAPLPPGQASDEPERADEDDVPARDHEGDGTQPGGRAHDGDEVERHAQWP